MQLLAALEFLETQAAQLQCETQVRMRYADANSGTALSRLAGHSGTIATSRILTPQGILGAIIPAHETLVQFRTPHQQGVHHSPRQRKASSWGMDSRCFVLKQGIL